MFFLHKDRQPQTQYSSLSDNDLYSLYRYDVWNELDETKRIELLQETVNRKAVQNGGQFSVRVSFEDLDPDVYGEYKGGTIRLNRSYFVDGKTPMDFISGRMEQFDVSENIAEINAFRCENFKALETTLHEFRHALQEKMCDGTVKADPETVRAFRSNNGNIRMIGKEQASQYMCSQTTVDGEYMYYLNPTELDAHRVSQEETMESVQCLNEKYGVDTHAKMYMEQLRDTGYEAKLNECREFYDNPHVDSDVAKVLTNSFYREHQPVDPYIEKRVHENMIATVSENKTLDNSATAAYRNSESSAVEDRLPTKSAAELLDASRHAQVGDYHDSTWVHNRGQSEYRSNHNTEVSTERSPSNRTDNSCKKKNGVDI